MKTGAKKLLNRTLLVLLYLSLPILLLSTNPQHLPIAFLVLPYLLLFLIIYVTTQLIIGKRFGNSRVASNTKRVIISGLFATIPVILVLLASIRQFTVWDILLSIAIMFFIAWYLIKVEFFH
jgi:hypothetical protein